MWVKNNTKSGFTIIEVLIVLAIAGLVLVIVLVAIPQLQRNARNNQRKNDVIKYMTAISEYAASNLGNISNVSDDVLNIVDPIHYINGEGRGEGQVKVTNLSNYTYSNPLNGTISDDRVQILLGATCNGSTAVQSSSMSYAAIYQLESANGFSAQCLAY